MSVGNGPTQPSFPRAIIHPLGPLFRHLPLSLRRHLLYWNVYRRWGNFKNPTLASEKMQWRIINDHRPLLQWTADKLAQKEYVKEIAQRNNLPIRIPASFGLAKKQKNSLIHCIHIAKDGCSNRTTARVDTASTSADLME